VKAFLGVIVGIVALLAACQVVAKILPPVDWSALGALETPLAIALTAECDVQRTPPPNATPYPPLVDFVLTVRAANHATPDCQPP